MTTPTTPSPPVHSRWRSRLVHSQLEKDHAGCAHRHRSRVRPRARVDQQALAELLAPGRSVATHAQLQQVGVPLSTITRRIQRGGPWQRLLPGVVAGHRGVPTTYERRLAALQYAGPGAALTGLDALQVQGVRLGELRRDARVHVLVPHECHRSSHGFALVTRSRRPAVPTVVHGLPCVGPARAVVDACRRTEDLGTVRELVAAVVQQRRCTSAELVEEVRLAARQRSALAREALAEITAGVRSAAEAQLRQEFQRFHVPMPLWNEPVRDSDGRTVAVADALWRDLMAVAELNSAAWHLSPAAYRRTQRRQRELLAHGYRVLPLSPADVHQDPEGTCRQVIDFLRACATTAQLLR